MTRNLTRIQYFVLASEAMSLVLLAGLVLVRCGRSPSGMQDFEVYYLAGRVALTGVWQDLYPVPITGAMDHPGYPGASHMRPGYAVLARESGREAPFRFVYPPPVAVLSAPFAALPVGPATAVWRATLVVGCWVAGVTAGQVYAVMTGRPTYVQGLLVLGAVCSLLNVATVRVANTSALTAAGIGVFVVAALTKRSWLGSVGFVLGGVFKYVSLPFLLIPAAGRDWRGLATCVAGGGALILLTLALAGTGPFLEFARLSPEFGHVTPRPANVSLASFVLLHTGGRDFSPSGRLIHSILALACLIAVAAGVVTAGRADRRLVTLAGTSGLVAWLLVFAPATGTHYFVYLVPFWGWYVWEAGHSWTGLLTTVIVIGGTWVPVGGSGWFNLPVWLNHHMLWAAITAYGFALLRLARLRAVSRQTTAGIA